MMETVVLIIWFLVFSKIILFWLWLWQLKEYHWKRFLAHFERQKLRKLFFSFYGWKQPKLTGKIILIFLLAETTGLFNAFFVFNLTGFSFYFSFLISLILAPLISSVLVLLFQIPTKIWIKIILSKAKRKKEQFKDLIVIGITGSYGKSSTKEFLAEILSEKFNVLKTEKNINAEVGIAKTILNKLKPEHRIFIAEIGAYEKGKIKEVCRMLKPKIGILTGINEQHLSTFGSLENIRKAKYELIDSLPKDRIAVIYDKLELIAEDIVVEKEFISFTIYSQDGDSGVFRVNLLGKHNIDNILLAASCAKKLGMSLEEISKACLKIKQEQGGMKLIKKDGPVVIDSSYSANPDGVIADLDYLKIYSGRKIVVMPCLIELGPASSGIHQKISRKIAEICDLAIITTKDYFKEMAENSSHPFLMAIEDPKEIIKKIKEIAKEEDVVLLEGRVPKKVIDFFKQILAECD